MSNIDIFDFASNVSTDLPPNTSTVNNIAPCITETIEDIKFNNDGSKVFLLHRTDNFIVEYFVGKRHLWVPYSFCIAKESVKINLFP